VADLTQAIQDIAAAPQSVTEDGQTFSEHGLKDLIAADLHLAERAAQAPVGGRPSSPLSRILRAQAVPPGANGC